MRKKRFLAVVLSAAMVASNAVVASAAIGTSTGTDSEGKAVTSYNASGTNITGEASDTITGTGYLTDRVDDKVFKVVVPTQRETGEADLFDFILDPQGLIDATAAAKYISGANVGGSKLVSVDSYTKGSLYFVNSANDGTKKLTNTSDEFQIINKSTMDIDVSMNAKLTAAGGIAISTDKSFANNKQPAVYLGFMRTEPTAGTETAISDNDSLYIDKAQVGNAKRYYQVSVDSSGAVTYDIPSQNADGSAESGNQYKSYKFKLTGCTNTEADWNSLTSGTIGPAVTITYHLTEHVEKAPSIAVTDYQITSGRGVAVAVDLGSDSKAATGITSITFENGTKTLPTDKYNYKTDTKQIVFTSALVDALFTGNVQSRDYTITFNDPAKTQVTVTLHQ